AVFLIRQLELLSLRIWDEGHDGAADRLAILQQLLDRVNTTGTGPAFVRDIRWLIQTAQGPLTAELSPYFTVASHLEGSLGRAARLETHKAGARLGAGHLRSQLRYRAVKSQKR